MQRIIFIALLATALLHAMDVSGRWDGPIEMKDRDGEPVVFHLLLKQEGNKVSGGVWTADHYENHPLPMQNGVLNGSRLRFDVPQRADAVVTFELEVSTDTLNGTIRFQGPNCAQEVRASFKRLLAR